MTASATATIVNGRGLHARASARFVAEVAALPDGHSVEVTQSGANSAAGGSILSLMMLGAAKGDAIAIAVDGPEEEGGAGAPAGAGRERVRRGMSGTK